MTDKTKELLAVLDNERPEKALKGWAYRNNRDLWRDLDGGGFREISNADLAFRLRDEAVKGSSDFHMVWVRWCDISWSERKKEGEKKKHVPFHRFWYYRAKPIHWIIAALCAKEKGNE